MNRISNISKSQLLKLQKKYKTDDAIGGVFGITRQAVHQLRVKYGVLPVAGKYESRNQELTRLYLNGIQCAQLARKYRLSISQVFRILRVTKPVLPSSEVPVIRKRPRKPVRG